MSNLADDMAMIRTAAEEMRKAHAAAEEANQVMFQSVSMISLALGVGPNSDQGVKDLMQAYNSAIGAFKEGQAFVTVAREAAEQYCAERGY